MTLVFDALVQVTGSPKLRLAGGDAATFYEGGASQIVDVGVFAAPPLESGAFELLYDGRSAGCLGWDASPADVEAALGAINVSKSSYYDPAKPHGILAGVDAAPKGGGTRFVFAFHADAAAKPLSVGPTYVCDILRPAAYGAVAKRGVGKEVRFRYTVGASDTMRYLDVAGRYQGMKRERKSQLQRLISRPLSTSFRLTFGRAIIARNGLEARMLSSGTRARGTLELKRRCISLFLSRCSAPSTRRCATSPSASSRRAATAGASGASTSAWAPR